MKTALVTGGAGFLGSNLVKSLVKDGYFVHVYDNLQTGFKSNLEGLSTPQVNFTRFDITQPYNCKVNEIWNLACPASPQKYQANKIHTFMTSVKGVENALMNSYLHSGSKIFRSKVFQASTSEVYGDPQVSEQEETYWGNVNPVGIRSCYDEGKRAAETLMTDWHEHYKTPIAIARIFNTYGPGMDKDDGRVVTNFINQALRGEDITIYGNGEQTRSFCYVDDLIRGFRLLMNSNISTPVNLGNPVEFTVLELAEKVIKKTNSKSKLVFLPLPGDDPKQRKPNISKAKTNLGWEPKVSLDEGLDLTIEYFKRKM